MNTGGRRVEGTGDPPRTELPINQIAIRVESVQHSQPGAAASLDIGRRARLSGRDVRVMVAQRLPELFQIELFEFRKPTPKPRIRDQIVR